MSHALIPSRPLVGFLVLQVAALALCGCGRSEPQGRITGRVSFKGQPLTDGQVNLFKKDTGTSVTAPLDKQGRFTVSAPMATGTYNVSFTPPLPKQLPPGTAVEEVPPYPVPAKFLDPVQSDLTAEVKKGANDLTITVPES